METPSDETAPADETAAIEMDDVDAELLEFINEIEFL
jgi:hypothetical protein